MNTKALQQAAGRPRVRPLALCLALLLSAMAAQGCELFGGAAASGAGASEAALKKLAGGQDLRSFTDSEGGYRLRYPKDWAETVDFTDTRRSLELKSPDGVSLVNLTSGAASPEYPPFDRASDKELLEKADTVGHTMKSVYSRDMEPEDNVEASVVQINGKRFFRAVFYGKDYDSGKRCEVACSMGVYNGKVYLVEAKHPAVGSGSEDTVADAIAACVEVLDPVKQSASPAPTPAAFKTVTDSRLGFAFDVPENWTVDRKDAGGRTDITVYAGDGKSRMTFSTEPNASGEQEYGNVSWDELTALSKRFFEPFVEKMKDRYVVYNVQDFYYFTMDDAKYAMAAFRGVDRATGDDYLFMAKRTVMQGRVYFAMEQDLKGLAEAEAAALGSLYSFLRVVPAE